MDGHRIELNFPGTMAGFERGFDELRRSLLPFALDAGASHRVELVFEEIVANIVRHGSADGHTPDVRVAIDLGAAAIVLTFDDDGVAFDPSGREDPAPPKSLEEAPVGGLGLMLVRHAAVGFDYERTGEQRNRLVVTVAAKTAARATA